MNGVDFIGQLHDLDDPAQLLRAAATFFWAERLLTPPRRIPLHGRRGSWGPIGLAAQLLYEAGCGSMREVALSLARDPVWMSRARSLLTRKARDRSRDSLLDAAVGASPKLAEFVRDLATCVTHDRRLRLSFIRKVDPDLVRYLQAIAPNREMGLLDVQTLHEFVTCRRAALRRDTGLHVLVNSICLRVAQRHTARHAGYRLIEWRHGAGAILHPAYVYLDELGDSEEVRNRKRTPYDAQETIYLVPDAVDCAADVMALHTAVWPPLRRQQELVQQHLELRGLDAEGQADYMRALHRQRLLDHEVGHLRSQPRLDSLYWRLEEKSYSTARFVLVEVLAELWALKKMEKRNDRAAWHWWMMTNLSLLTGMHSKRGFSHMNPTEITTPLLMLRAVTNGGGSDYVEEWIERAIQRVVVDPDKHFVRWIGRWRREGLRKVVPVAGRWRPRAG